MIHILYNLFLLHFLFYRDVVNLNLHNKNYKNNNSYLFNDFYLGGISINIGMIYEIKNIGTNIFGRLDPFKVY